MSFHPETESYKYWTQEEDLKLKDLVGLGLYDFKKIGELMGRSASSCQSHSSVLGLSNTYVRRKYQHNEEFFKVPNILNCYWAGFLAADGSIREYGKNVEKRSSEIRLEIADIDHLYQFKKDIGFTGSVEDCYRYDELTSTKMVRINSRYWGDDLRNNFSIIQNKTHRLSPPNLDSDVLKFAFLIGYIDGDGCVCLANRKEKLELAISVTSCSTNILIFLKDLIDKFFSTYKLKRKQQSIGYFASSLVARRINIAGMQAVMILDFLKDFPVPKLHRKWHNPRVLEFLAKKRAEYPDFFTFSPALQSIKDEIKDKISISQ